MNPRLLAISLLLTSSPTNAKVRVQAEKLLRFCNSFDTAGLIQAFDNHVSPKVLDNIPADYLADYMMRQCLDHGGFDIKLAKSETPKTIVATVVGRKSRVESELTLIEDDKGKLEMPSLDPMPLSGWSVPADLRDDAVIKTIQNEVKNLGETGLFSGIVVIARGSTVFVSETQGLANRSRKTKFTGSSQFTLASISKVFTAIAVGQLVDQKKLSFDDKVGGFFPDYPNKLVRDQVSVGMLLSHMAGMGDILDKRPATMLKEGWKRAETFVPLTAVDDLKYIPGTRQDYSNAGLALAGAIVEKVSGMDYPLYLRKHIFELSEMTGSDPNNIPFQGPQLVTPYTRRGKDWQIATADLGSPAGGAISTADDLVKFADALRTGKLVSKATFDQIKKPRFDQGGPFAYGYGMSIEKVADQEWIGHNGGFDGVSTEFSLMPDGPYTLVILENRDPPASEWLGQRLRAILSAKVKRDSVATDPAKPNGI